MRTPREAATSRAHGVTMAPADASTSPPAGVANTSSAVTMSFTRSPGEGMVARPSVPPSAVVRSNRVLGARGPDRHHASVLEVDAGQPARDPTQGLVGDRSAGPRHLVHGDAPSAALADQGGRGPDLDAADPGHVHRGQVHAHAPGDASLPLVEQDPPAAGERA